MMNIQKIALIALSAAFGCMPAMANDAHHDDHAAPAPSGAHAKEGHAAPPAAAKKDDAPAPAAAHDAATAAKDEPAAKAEPRKPKPKRKKAKAEVKPAADTKHAAGGHDDAHSVPVPPTLAPVSRVRVKDRAAAAAAVAATQVASDHAAPAAAAADEHAGHDAPAPVAAEPHAAHDTPAAPAAPAAAVDAHDGHAAPAVPAAIAPTKRARVKASLPAASAPAVATHSAHDQPAAAASAHDAQGAQNSHASHDAPVAQNAPAVHDHPEPVQSAAAPAVSTETAPLAEACNPPLKSEIAALFDRWNASLRSGDPKKVVANYAPESVLLPTVSNRARFTVAEKEDYFMHFLQRRPQGYIDDRIIDVDCNSATDAGLYTFRFSDGASVKARYSFSYKKINGQWLITSHHSSGMPEKPESPVAHAPEVQSAPKAVEPSGPTKGWVRFP